MAKQQRSYTPEFRRSAVCLVTEHGYTHSEAAKRLGIPLHTLKYWLKQARLNGDVRSAEVQSEADELRRLRKENQQLLLENEILKKAAAYFAKESL